MTEFAKKIMALVGNPAAYLDERPLPVDDPKKRRPNTLLAKETLGWQPKVSREEGLQRTLPYFLEAVKGKVLNR
jgi:dTDP-glucose 4,6-dehydratase